MLFSDAPARTTAQQSIAAVCSSIAYVLLQMLRRLDWRERSCQGAMLHHSAQGVKGSAR